MGASLKWLTTLAKLLSGKGDALAEQAEWIEEQRRGRREQKE
jgi:hypothetical protein